MVANTTALHKPKITFRKPVAEDGARVWELIRACKPLDENSMYCNLLQCDHFADTCIVAELNGDIVGWISAYLVPSAPDTLFIWQVAVSDKARGQGLGRRMIAALLDRQECAGVRRIQTTITRENAASWALFSGFAARADGDLGSEPHFERRAHFEDRHDTEHLVTIEFGDDLSKAA